MDNSTLLDKAPGRPGKPVEPGNTIWRRKDQTEISDVREESSIRFHLGYCACGQQITAGYNRMGYLIEQMQKKHFPIGTNKPTFKQKIAKILLDE